LPIFLTLNGNLLFFVATESNTPSIVRVLGTSEKWFGVLRIRSVEELLMTAVNAAVINANWDNY